MKTLKARSTYHFYFAIIEVCNIFPRNDEGKNLQIARFLKDSRAARAFSSQDLNISW